MNVKNVVLLRHSLTANGSRLGEVAEHKTSLGLQMFNMSTEDKLKTVSPTFGNTVLPAVVGSQTKYQIIYADPAWLYQCGKNHLGKKSMINGKTDIHYNGMPIKEMQKLNVNNIADENCLLFMWVTSPFLKIGIDLMNKWGFEFSTIGFVWNKEKTNPGSYTLSECEVCIIGKKVKYQLQEVQGI